MSEILERSDVRMLEQAVRNRWQLPEQLYVALPTQMMRLLAHGTPREQIAAARVLALLHQANEEAEHPAQVQVMHAHVHQITGEESNVRRRGLSERIARLSANTRRPGSD